MRMNCVRCTAFVVVIHLLGCASSPTPDLVHSPTPARQTDDVDHQVRFLVFGDMPYFTEATDEFPARTFEPDLLKHIFPQLVLPGEHAFLVHVGDIKAAAETCSEESISRNMKLIARIYPGKTIYLPGDNEWTDCDRHTDNSELEWLGFVMSQMDIFELDADTRTKLEFSTPSEKRGHGGENSSWTLHGIDFVALHVPSTNMGRSEILNDDPVAVFARADERDRFNQQYLTTAFQRATNRSAKALVVFMQADIVKHPEQNRDVECHINNRDNCDGFAPIRDHLIKTARAFDGPMLLVHGDTGGYCLDRPFMDVGLENLWRLNAPGDFRVADIAEVTVDILDTELPFKVTGRLVQLPAPDSCQP